MIEDEPLIASARDLTVNDLRRAKVFMENSDPRNLAPGENSAFTVDEADLELLVNIDSCSMRSVCRKRPGSLLVVAHF